MKSVKWPADKVERRKVNSLVPYARNARTHSPEQVDQIAAQRRGSADLNAPYVEVESGTAA